MKDTLLYIIVGVLILAILIGSMFVFGFFGNRYEETIVKENIDIKRENFEHSKSYVHGMVEDLSKYKLELARTEDKVERKAIISYIQENFANFDVNLIENDNLRWFLQDVMNGEVE